jgi:3-oxoacyl-[acyl-carrier protein] reductase
MIDLHIDGRVTIVTGVDNPRGIGAAIARSLSAQGARILVTYLEIEPRALHTEISEAGGEIISMHADLADPQVIPLIFDRAEADFGPVEILVNNAAASDEDSFRPDAGVAPDRMGRQVHPISAATIDFHFAVNSRAVALTMAEFARRHAARNASWGRIVNISTDGTYRFPGEVSYGASKLALEGYSRSAAVELAPHGITVNIVSPGATQTGWIPEGMEGELGREMPMGRVGMPEDIAESVLFFCSAQAGWLTGQTLHAGGGHRM